MLYLLVFTYFVSLFAFNARQSIENKLRLADLIALRLLVPVVQYLFISLWISLVTLVFKVSFERFYGRGGFPLFWCSNFLAQWAAGMPMEVALSLLGPKYTAFFCESLSPFSALRRLFSSTKTSLTRFSRTQ